MGLDTIYQDLEFQPGEVVLPGIKNEVLCVSKRDIVQWPKLPTVADAAAIEDLVVYADDFVLAAGKKWNAIDARVSESGVSSESQGEAPSKTSLNKLTIVHNGVEEAATAFARQANNDDLVYICRVMSGKYRVVGNENWATSTKVAQDNGKSVTDKAGTTIEIEVSDLCPAPFYRGKLAVTDGELDCLTGVVTAPAG